MSVVDTATGEVVEILDRDSAFILAKRITRQVAKVNTETGHLIELAADALKGKAWVSLGYGSWAEMVEACGWEFTPKTSTDRAALAIMFRESGMSFRAIGKVVGASAQTVMRDTASATVPNGTVHGEDGKARAAKSMGEAGTGDGPAMSSGGPSPAFDPGEAALGDDADTPSPFPSPGSPIDVELNEAAPSTPVEADGTARPDASTGPLIDGLANAAEFFATFSPGDIHQLDDPEVTATVEHLIAVARNWANEFEAIGDMSRGWTVIEGGRQ